MKKIFEKNETLFCILLIVFYIIVNSYCIQNFGIEDYRSTIINTIFLLWTSKSKQFKKIFIFYTIIIDYIS